MLTSPCFSAAACQQGGASYPSMGRALLQARDLTVWMARALGMVQTANMPKLVQLLTELGELLLGEAGGQLEEGGDVFAVLEPLLLGPVLEIVLIVAILLDPAQEDVGLELSHRVILLLEELEDLSRLFSRRTGVSLL